MTIRIQGSTSRRQGLDECMAQHVTCRRSDVCTSTHWMWEHHNVLGGAEGENVAGLAWGCGLAQLKRGSDLNDIMARLGGWLGT